MAPSKFRFSIRTILIIIAYAAIALPGLVHPTRAWVGVMYGITVVLLFYSIVTAIYQTERARAFWIGFALFGVGYLGLLFGPFAELSLRLPTTQLLGSSCEIFHGPASYPAQNPYSSWLSPSSPLSFVVPSSPSGYTNNPTEVPYMFVEIGQAIFAMLFAALGGVIAQYQYASRAGKETVRTRPSMSEQEIA
jgi:hypothetical protein